MIKISIIVAVYNVDKFLDECILSLINQTLNEIEIIIVNDGSTDGSSFICEKYKLLDERIILINKKNAGLVSARKFGIEIARGKYSIFVDGDDKLDEYACEKMFMIAEKLNVDFIHFNYKTTAGNKICYIKKDEIINLVKIDRKKLFIDSVICNEETNMQSITPSIWSKLFVTSFIKKVYMKTPDDQSYGEDLICLYNCIMQSQKCALSTMFFYNYRIHAASMSHKWQWSTIERIVKLKEIISKLLGEAFFSEIERYFFRIVVNYIEESSKNTAIIPKCIISDITRFYNKNIILYGAGNVGIDYYNQLVRYSRINIIAWVDCNFENINIDYFKIQSPDYIKDVKFDYIVIAINDMKMATEIRKDLVMTKKINDKKIIWSKPEWIV